MELFSVNLSFRVITPSENDGKLLVLIDDDGNFPSVMLGKEPCIEEQVYQRLNEFLYECDMEIAYSTRQVSSIMNDGNIVTILYTFISTSTASKMGSFINFDKNSIELYRMVNNKTL